MANAVEVTDSISNAEEQIERAAKAIGRSESRRKVFSAIYYHKKKIKTITELTQKTKLPRMRVLQEAGRLFKNSLVRQRKKPELAYEKIDFFDLHKARILRLAGNPAELAKIPTKRKISVKLP